MKKVYRLFLVAIILLALPNLTFGQASFSHSFGAAYYLSSSTISSAHSESSTTIGAPAILYSPRINFVEIGREMTVSVGTHLGLGMSNNTMTGSRSLALDLPLVAEINFGHGAHADTRSSVGGFAGIGYGISRLGADNENGNISNEASGPVLNAGVRALLNDVPVGFRLSYLLNTKEGGNVAGVGFFYTFGFR
jgi:hypothetical protein